MAEGLDLVFDADGGGEAGEEDAAGFEGAPELGEHGVEVGFVAGEMEDGVGDDEVEMVVGEGQSFDGFATEVDGIRLGGGVLIDGEDLVSIGEEVREVASAAAAGVEDAHAGLEAAAQELIDEIDVGGGEEMESRGEHQYLVFQLLMT